MRRKNRLTPRRVAVAAVGLVVTVIVAALATLTGTASAATVTVTQVNQQGWNFATEPGGNYGHYEFRAGLNAGLYMWTQPTSTFRAVVSGHVPVASTPLTTVAAAPTEPAMVFQMGAGGTIYPDYHMRLVGTINGVLQQFSLSKEYGGTAWTAINCSTYCGDLGIAPTNGEYVATLDQWAAARPGDNVTRVGFYLYATTTATSGTLKNLTFMNTTWQFVRAIEPRP